MFKTLNKQKLQTALLRHGPGTLKHFGNIIRDSLLGNTALVLLLGEAQYLQTIQPHKTTAIVFSIILKLTFTIIFSWLLVTVFFHMQKITGKITVITYLLYFIWLLTIQLVLYFSLNNFLHSLPAVH